MVTPLAKIQEISHELKEARSRLASMKSSVEAKDHEIRDLKAKLLDSNQRVSQLLQIADAYTQMSASASQWYVACPYADPCSTHTCFLHILSDSLLFVYFAKAHACNGTGGAALGGEQTR